MPDRIPDRSRRSQRVLTSATLLLCLGAAQADQPSVSESAAVISDGACQFDSGLSQRAAERMPSARRIDVLATCGVSAHSQLGMRLGSARQPGATDLGLSLDGKTALQLPHSGAIGYALAYGIRSDKASGQGWRHGSTHLLGVATKALTKALLGHLNLGWVRTGRDRLNSTTWSLGMEGEGALRWAADVYGDDRSRAWVSAGLLFPLADRISASLAYAQQFEQPRQRQWTLGFKFAL